VREALFSSLGERVRGARVLDLFAGTGALGLEALSRGASFAVFVEKQEVVRRVLRANIDDLGFGDNSKLLASDAALALKKLAFAKEPFDLIFLDPPYAKTLLSKALDSIGSSNIITEQTVIVAEHKKGAVPILPKSLHLVTTKSYGDVALSIIEKTDAESSGE
jgi:16S rRNA (guanine966-N2)-methyltransferase